MILVYPDKEALIEAAAQLLMQKAKSAVETSGRFSVALSGGSTPQPLYERLAQPPYRKEMPWQDMHFFWGDERCVPLDNPRSNARMAKRTLLDKVPVPAEQIHPIRCTQDPQMAAHAYETTLRGYFVDGRCRFDFIWLGLGKDGHTASLFPGATVLEEEERWVAAVPPQETDLWRVTLTPWIINLGQTVAFLVEGEDKAPTLREVIEGQYRPKEYPAQLIRPLNKTLYWLLDEAAAKRLKLET